MRVHVSGDGSMISESAHAGGSLALWGALLVSSSPRLLVSSSPQASVSASLPRGSHGTLRPPIQGTVGGWGDGMAGKKQAEAVSRQQAGTDAGRYNRR
jgi:hypothetical protein